LILYILHVYVSFSRVVIRNQILISVISDTTRVPVSRVLYARFAKQCHTFSGAYLAKASDSQFATATRLRNRVFILTRWQLWIQSRSKGLGVAWRFMIVTLQAVSGGM